MNISSKSIYIVAAAILFLTSCSGTVSGANSTVPEVTDDVSAASLPVQPGPAAGPIGGAGAFPYEAVEPAAQYASAEAAAATAGVWKELQLDSSTVFEFDAEELETDWEDKVTKTIDLSGESSVTISEEGVYRLTGEMPDGQVIVEAGKKDIVVLVLDSVSITSDDAPVLIENSDKTIVVLADGSVNYLADRLSAAVASGGDSESKDEAVILSRDDLIITGGGSLRISANRDNGIQGKDSVTIAGGEIIIDAVDDGIIGKDDLTILDTQLTITAGGDAVKSTNDNEGSEGYIAISGGTFNLQSGNDAIQAAGSILIAGGDFVISAASGSSAGLLSTESCKGMKAGMDLTITGGNFLLESIDDSLHSNQSIHIAGGRFLIVSGDDAVHADEALVINDGNITIAGCYEGLESFNIFVTGGSIEMVASDDGFNAADTGTAATEPGFFNRNPGGGGGMAAGNMLLVITGGEIVVNAAGDGLDSNGSIYMSGGDVTVYGPTDNMNGTLDCNGEFIISGGSLVGAGSSGMIEAPETVGGQGAVVMTLSSTAAAGTTVTLLDGSGSVLASCTPQKRFQSVVFSMPEISAGKEYSITVGSVVDASFTAAENTVWMNESGVTTAMGGIQGFGGGDRMDRGMDRGIKPGGDRPTGAEMPPGRNM